MYWSTLAIVALANTGIEIHAGRMAAGDVIALVNYESDPGGACQAGKPCGPDQQGAGLRRAGTKAVLEVKSPA